MNRQANRIDRNSLCDTKAPLNLCTTANRNRSPALAHASCRITPFRRDRVSKVCYRGGVLLAFVAPLATFGKCKENRPILTPLDRPLQNLNKTKWVNLVKLPRLRPDSGTRRLEHGAHRRGRIYRICQFRYAGNIGMAVGGKEK
jgi:hypothetical protein